MALVTLPDGAQWPGTRRTRLFRSRLTVVGRPGHPLARARALAELASAEWILMGSPGGPGATVLRLFADRGLQPPRVAEPAPTPAAAAFAAMCRSWARVAGGTSRD
jgi:LysR family transcriptional regulator of abg operon